MKILVTGQCTLHWGRMEFGNIGNYYIVEPLFRELCRVFPGAEIRTTFQMSDEFCRRENVWVLPMDYYYGWNDRDMGIALAELQSASMFAGNGFLPMRSGYLEEVLGADLVVDFSGDIWGDNADFLGSDRFLVGLCKDRVAQLLGKPTAMIAGSPGPFGNPDTMGFAMEVYSHFDLVTNREPLSIGLAREAGLDTSRTSSLACPAFLFEPASASALDPVMAREGLDSPSDKVCFLICGWNFTVGPFDIAERKTEEFDEFATAIEAFCENHDVEVWLMSHSNGFPVPPAEFRLSHGRDYPLMRQLKKVLEDRGRAGNLHSLDGVYDPWMTKALLSRFEMVVSGRVHGAVAATSMNVPTVFIDYGHEPKAHKIAGFAELVGAGRYVADPASAGDLGMKMEQCWQNRENYRSDLEVRIPVVRAMARKSFDLLEGLV